MTLNRLRTLKTLVEQNPSDTRSRYMLAMELGNAGDLVGAVGEFEAVVRLDPDYAYAYYHAGQMLERLGRPADARRMYSRGLEAAARKGDAKARDELQAALDALPAP